MASTGQSVIEDIAPWYDYVESFIGVSGQAEGIPHLPDGKFLPPMEMNCVEKASQEFNRRKIPWSKGDDGPYGKSDATC